MGWGAGAGAEIHREQDIDQGPIDQEAVTEWSWGQWEDEVGWAKGDDGDENHGRVTKRKWEWEPGKGAKGREVKGPCGIMPGWVVGHTGERRSRTYF